MSIRVRSVATGSCLFGNGSVLEEYGPDLIGLSTSTFSEQFAFTVTPTMTLDYPWASSGVAVHPDQDHVLLYNRYLSLMPCTSVTQLRLSDVVKADNVHPEPFAISPDGRRALVLVHSYMEGALSALAVFDLLSGRALRRIMKGEMTEAIINGCFLSDREVCLWLRGGAFSILPVQRGGDRFPLEASLSPLRGGGIATNLAMVPFE